MKLVMLISEWWGRVEGGRLRGWALLCRKRQKLNSGEKNNKI